MFKLNTDLQNDNTPPLSFTLEQLFDPRVHIVPADFTITQNTLIPLLQRIFTRENIINYPTLFFPKLSQNNSYGFGSDFNVAAFIAPFSDDNLWTLYYMHVGRIEDRQYGRIFLNPYIVFDFGETDCNVYSVYNYDTRTFRSTDHYTNLDTWTVFISPLIQDVIRTIHSRITDNARFRNHSLHINNNLIPFVQHLLHYYGNHQQYLSQETLYRRTEIASILATSSEAVLSVRPHPFTLTIRNPISPTNRSPLYTTLSYSTNPLDLLRWPITLKHEHNPLLYGVELELSTSYDQRTLVDAAKDMFFILKSDSSISGSHAFRYELCTIPMSFKAHRQQWAYWFQHLDYTQFDQTKDTTNGLHIHIHRDAFKQDHLKRFAWFFTQPAHNDFMLAVSERDSRSFHEYSKLPLYPAEKVRSYVNTLDYCARIRGCINLSSKNTVEVRLFRGIVSLAEILKNLEFVDSVYHFTQDANYQQLTLDNYYAWLLKTNRNRYTLLKKYFDQIPNFSYLLASSDIHRIIHTERNATSIMARLEKAKLMITQAHVTILNKIFKKRVFILDKATGKLTLSHHNHGKLAFLDRSLETKLLRNTPQTAPPSPPAIPTAEPPAANPSPLFTGFNTPPRTLRRRTASSPRISEPALIVYDDPQIPSINDLEF